MDISKIEKQLAKYQKCSIGKYTRVKDARNFLANMVHELDQRHNVVATIEDAKKKCEIFKIDHLCQDFTDGEKLTGAMEHLVPLAGELKSKGRVGSDSFWNRIPVSGSNRTYNETPAYAEKIRLWVDYVNQRGATLYYNVDRQFFEIMKQREESLIAAEDSYREMAMHCLQSIASEDDGNQKLFEF